MLESYEDSEVPDAGPPGAVGNQVRQLPEPSASEIVTSYPTLLFESFSSPSTEAGLEHESNNDPGDSFPPRHRPGSLGQESGVDANHSNSHSLQDNCFSSDTGSRGKLIVENHSLSSESSIETGPTAPKTTEHQHGAQVSKGRAPIYNHPPRLSVPGHGQHRRSPGTSQPLQEHMDDQRCAPPLRSQPARPRVVSQPERNTNGASRAPLISDDLHPPSLENSSENDPLADHRGCPPACRSHSYSAVLFYAAEDEKLALTFKKQLQTLQVSHLGVQERRVRVALFPHVSPYSTTAETFLEILKNHITPYIFILRTMQYHNSDGDNEFGDWMIAQAVRQPLNIIQIDFVQKKFEKHCLTKLILYDDNSQLFQSHMRELLRGRFLDEQVRHDVVRKKCKHSRTEKLVQIRPTKSRQRNKRKEESSTTSISATSSSGRQGDISNNSDTESVLSSETERRSWLNDVRDRPSSTENGSKAPGNNRPELTICPKENGGHQNSADSRSGAASTDWGSDYIPVQRENGSSSDTQSSRVSNTKVDIICFNRVSSSQSSESAVSDDGRMRQVRKDNRQIKHSNSSSNNMQKQNLPVRDEISSSPDVTSDSGSCSIKSRTVHEKPDAEKKDGHLKLSCNSIATHSLLENAQDRNQRAQESATSLPSPRSRPSEFPQSKPVAVVVPRAPQNEDQAVNGENTVLKSYVREERHETDISSNRKNRAGCEQDPHNSVNPNRTVALQEDSNGRVRHNDTHQQRILSPQQFNTIPQQNTVSPQQTDASSRQHHVSPEQLIVSPEQRNASTHQPTIRTQQHIVSPQHPTVSQGQELSSSQQRNSSPGQHAVSHQEHNTSPQPDNENPQRHTVSEHHIVSPQEHNASFQQHTVNAQEHTISSQQHSDSPEEYNTSFQQNIVRPQEHHTSPQGHTASLEQPSACPQQNTCGPQQDTSTRNSSASSTSHILNKNGCPSHAQATSPPGVEDDSDDCARQLVDYAARRRCRLLRLWKRVRSRFACASSKKRRSRRRSGEID